MFEIKNNKKKKLIKGKTITIMNSLIFSLIFALCLASTSQNNDTSSVYISQDPATLTQNLTGFQMNIFPASGSWFNV